MTLPPLRVAAIILTTCAFTPISAAVASADDVLASLRANIPVISVGFGPAAVESRAIEVTVTNNTNAPLGGVWVAFAIWADNRPQPLYAGSIRPAATIAGALMPGESITARDFHFMEEREKELARHASDLRLTVAVENAADGKMNGFLPQPQMASWSNALSDQMCEARIAK